MQNPSKKMLQMKLAHASMMERHEKAEVERAMGRRKYWRRRSEFFYEQLGLATEGQIDLPLQGGDNDDKEFSESGLEENGKRYYRPTGPGLEIPTDLNAARIVAAEQFSYSSIGGDHSGSRPTPEQTEKGLENE